jgi:hypothetical protein
MNHTSEPAATAAMAPNAAPPTTLPAIAPALGALGLGLTVWVTVAAACVDVDVGVPLLPVKRGRPAHAVVCPAEVK